MDLDSRDSPPRRARRRRLPPFPGARGRRSSIERRRSPQSVYRPAPASTAGGHAGTPVENLLPSGRLHRSGFTKAGGSGSRGNLAARALDRKLTEAGGRRGALTSPFPLPRPVVRPDPPRLWCEAVRPDHHRRRPAGCGSREAASTGSTSSCSSAGTSRTRSPSKPDGKGCSRPRTDSSSCPAAPLRGEKPTREECSTITPASSRARCPYPPNQSRVAARATCSVTRRSDVQWPHVSGRRQHGARKRLTCPARGRAARYRSSKRSRMR